MTRVGLAVHRTFHSLHTRNFRLYFIGQVVSVTGTWLNATASAWLVLRLSNSGFALGFNTALTFLPILLVGAFGGMLADRYDKRKILILTQAMYATLALTLFVAGRDGRGGAVDGLHALARRRPGDRPRQPDAPELLHGARPRGRPDERRQLEQRGVHGRAHRRRVAPRHS